MPVADLKVGPLPEIVADRPVNGGSEIPASRVQAAQKNFFRYREMVEIYEFRDRREVTRLPPGEHPGPKFLARALWRVNDRAATFPGLKGGGKHRTLPPCH